MTPATTRSIEHRAYQLAVGQDEARSTIKARVSKNRNSERQASSCVGKKDISNENERLVQTSWTAAGQQIATKGAAHVSVLANRTRTGAAEIPLSVVIPMKNEVAAVKDILDGCRAAARAFDSFELCITNDGSTDDTGEALAAWAAEHKDTRVVIITHAQSAGQSAAIHSAVLSAAGRFIVTLDGDGQNPPDQIGKTVAPLLAAPKGSLLALVAGQRVKRDDPFAKRAASRFANILRAALLRDGTRDTGCGLKAFRRDAYLALPYFDHMHRYLPALFQRDGWEVAHVDVTHRPRASGISKYNNFHRALVGVTDLLGVAWLIRRRKRISLAGTTKNVSEAAH